MHLTSAIKGKGSPDSITEHRVPELILVLGSQPAGDVSHKSGDRLPLLSTSDLIFSRPRSEGWPHYGRTFSIYPCPLSF